jgi:uncharacterized protein YjbI with pentapeptide repeats
MLFAVLAMPASARPPAQPGSGDAEANRQAEAELRKLAAETAHAKAETTNVEHDDELWTPLLSIAAPLLTAVAAGATVVFSVLKVGSDRRDAIEREALNREAAREAAELERFDERFAKAVTGLSSAKPGEEIGAAVLVTSMVREKSEALSSQALQLLLVSLQAPHSKACERLLRFALERFARAAPYRLLATGDGEPMVDLTHTRAPHLNLAHLELPGLDIAFASLPNADFRGADLSGSRAYKAEMEDAIFSNAKLEKVEWAEARATRARFRYADLRRAQLRLADLGAANFFRADLRKARLRQANLLGARFEQASLEGTDFHGAQLDDRALESILRADSWGSAYFNRDTQSRLDDLASKTGERQAL